MISPVIVQVREGLATAHCEHHAHPFAHALYVGKSVRDAEAAADAHLKDIRDGQAP